MKAWPHGALVVYLVALAFGVPTPQPPLMPFDPEAAPRPPDGLAADTIRNLFHLMWLGREPAIDLAQGQQAPVDSFRAVERRSARSRDGS